MEDINKVSSEWKEVRLGKLCNVKGGKRLPKGETLQSFPTSHPYIRIRDLNNSKNIEVDSSYEYITKDVHDKISRYITNEGDILISIVGTIGLIAKVGKSLDGANLTENCVKLIDLKEISVEFLYYFLTSCHGKNEIDKGIVGAVQAKLPIKNIKDILIKLPPLHEQKKISFILKSLDDKIELNNQMNQTLEEMAQAIFKEWFVEFNFPNEDGVPYKDNGGEMKESELGEIPEGWRVSNFGKVSNCYDSKRIPLSKNKRLERQGEYPYHGATSIMDYVDDYIFDGIYLMLGEDGSVIKEDGTPFIQYVWGKIWVNNHAHVLQGKNGISTEHLLVFSKQMDLNPYITGAVQLKLNQRNMNSIPFIRANNDVENSFNKIIQPLFSKIRDIYNENQILIKTRDTLLPKLMSGEVRI